MTVNSHGKIDFECIWALNNGYSTGDWAFGLGYTGITNSDRFTEGEWSTGFSLRSDTGRFDYAYLNGGDSDEGSHWIAATFRWNGIPNAAAPAPPERPAPILMPTPQPPPPKTVDPVTPPHEGQTDFEVSEQAISPNGDGVKDIASFRLTVPENVKWMLEIRDESDETVKRYSGAALSEETLMWGGEDDAGNLVNDGVYTAKFTALDSRNHPYFQRETTVEVDTAPADFEIRAEPLLVESSSESDTNTGLSAARITNTPVVHLQTADLNRIDRWELKIVASGGEVIDKLESRRPLSNAIVWNNRERPRLVNISEAYHFEMTIHDLAGNRSYQTTPLQLIDLSSRAPSVKEDTARQEEVVAEEAPPQREAPKREQADREVVLTLPGIAFDTGSYEINDNHLAVLDEAAEALLKYPEARATIEGHTDSIGDADYNLELSYQRSEAVKRYLVDEFGISPTRLKTVGYGEERPIVDNNAESVRHQNRRVEIALSMPASSHSGAGATSETAEHTAAASGDTSEPGSQAPVAFAEKAPRKWTLVVSSFKARKNAESLVENLKTLDIADDIRFSRVVINSQAWYRVTVGRFKERHEAVDLAEELRDSQGIDPIVLFVE